MSILLALISSIIVYGSKRKLHFDDKSNNHRSKNHAFILQDSTPEPAILPNFHIKDQQELQNREQRQAIYDACLRCDSEKVKILLERYNKDFPINKGGQKLQLNRAMQLAAESIECHDNMTNIFIPLLKDSISKKQYVGLDQITLVEEKKAMLVELFEQYDSANEEFEFLSFHSDLTPTLDSLAKFFNGDFSKIYKYMIENALEQSTTTLQQISSTFPQLLQEPNLSVYRDPLLLTGIPEVYRLIKAAPSQAKTGQESFIQAIDDAFLLTNSSNPLAGEILDDLLSTNRVMVISFVNNLMQKSTNLKRLLERASYEMVSRIFKMVKTDVGQFRQAYGEEAAQNRWNLFLRHLLSNLCSLAEFNKDSRVLPLALNQITEDIECLQGISKFQVAEWIMVVQKYLKHVIKFHKSEMELGKRLNCIVGLSWFQKNWGESKALNIPKLWLSGSLYDNPVFFAIICKRWGMVKVLLEFIDVHSGSISEKSTREPTFSNNLKFFSSMARMPWDLYQKLQARFNIRFDFDSLVLFEALTDAIKTDDCDDRVIKSLLGHPHPIWGQKRVHFDSDAAYNNKTLFTQFLSSQFQSTFTVILTFQLDGWLMEALDWLQKLLESQNGPKEQAQLELHRFHSFLIDFKNLILPGVITFSANHAESINHDEKLSPSGKDFKRPADSSSSGESFSAESNDNDDIIVQKDTISVEQESKLDFAALFRRQLEKMSMDGHIDLVNLLRRKVDWILQYLVSAEPMAKHPDVINVIFQECSPTFIFHLFKGNSQFAFNSLFQKS